MTTDQWVVAIRLPGNARYVIHGPFPSSAEADDWLHEKQLHEPKPPVQWRILPLLSPTDPSIVWRTQMEAMAFEQET